MKRKQLSILSTVMMLGWSTPAWAGQASTSASAGSRGWGLGTAAATANYDGTGPAYTKTRTRSGQVNLAQGIALGFDRNGLSLSSSYAVAPRRGPAVAGTFNVSIGLDGEVATSVGRTVAGGDRTRTVSAGGGSGSSRKGTPAWATTGGHTGPRGAVRCFTKSNHRRAPLRRPHRSPGRMWSRGR